MAGKTRLPNGQHKITCSKCGIIKEVASKNYCRKCSTEYIKEWRKTHFLSIEQKFKSNARRKTNMRIKRGLLLPYPCEICGAIKVEAHHDDYNKPYEIRWLCFTHHREHHKRLKEII